MAIVLMGTLYANRVGKVPERAERWLPDLHCLTFDRQIGCPARRQCAEWPLSSLLLVDHKIEATKTAMMTETTTNGDEICIVQAPCWF
jgi:hypothetical protein